MDYSELNIFGKTPHLNKEIFAEQVKRKTRRHAIHFGERGALKLPRDTISCAVCQCYCHSNVAVTTRIGHMQGNVSLVTRNAHTMENIMQ